MAPSKRKTFNEVVNDALEDIATNGYDSQERVDYWLAALRRAAEETMEPEAKVEQQVREILDAVYRSQIENKGALRMHPGVGLYTIDKVRPELRAELERRKAAARSLIKLDREAEMLAMEKRFSGWATAQPAGGTKNADKAGEREKIRKTLSGLSFRERRVMVDQGHKFQSAVSEIVAKGGGAIAAIWESHWRQANYDYRSEHKARAIESEKLPYVVRDNWALQNGLMKLGGSKCTDDMTKPGEEVFCRCAYKYIYSLRKLPESMLTAKGKAALAQMDKRAA